MNRRVFIQKAGLGSLVMSSGAFPLMAMHDPNIARLTILHTNDVHSRVEAFPMDGGRNAGQGGASRRASLIKKIRSREEHILLLDAGDIFQGTPYFNYFGGEIEMKLMSEMGYDAATIGNHDFDGGIDGLEKQLKHANFDMLIANYDFSNTVMKGKTKEYRIWQKGEIKVGVLGVGIALNSLVPKALYKDTVYSDPISNANRIANILKNDEKCDLVICLSHMGYNYKSENPCDTKLATNSKDIDIIIGGHTHTFMDEPDVRKNLNGEEVIINQVGWAGLMLGRLEVMIEKGKNKKCITCRNSYIR
ncbi:MAG: metallophosphatase [Saprospiraceae bacterium]|nr:metallophosphatase [Saprospiraceae bacterium]